MNTRREFVQYSALSLAGAGFVRAQSGAGADWFDKPMRWAQLNLTEDDPANMDVGFWLDYFKKIHADAVCLTAGGVVAFYPTRIPWHHKSEWLAGHESFLPGLIAGCRKLDMVVMLRTDPHATYEDVAEAHPDWIAVDAEGHKRRHWESPEMWVTCALGPYNFDFMTQVTKEIVSLYKPEGIFSNRWEGSGMCYCEHCRQNFRAASGKELPRTNNPQDLTRRAYILWREQRLFELWRLWDSEIRKIYPNARYIANSGGATSGLDMKTVGEMAPTLFADRQGRGGVMAPWSNGKNGKEYRAALGNKPIGGIFHMGVVTPYRWPDSVQNGSETRIWVLDGVANGLRPWFNKVSGSVHDHRWLKVVEDLYTWHHRCERYLRNEEAIARVAMVYSQQTSIFYGGSSARQKVEDHALGMYQSLIEARIPFEMVHDRLLDAAHVDRFKVLLLPNIAALSDKQCDQLRQYVQRGGSLVATYETSLCDEWGVRRKDFGLADLFGVSFGKRLDGPIPNSYLKVGKEAGKHPLLAGLQDAEQIIDGTWQLDVRPTATFDAPLLTRIPQYPSLPMEKNYSREKTPGAAGIYLRELGKSRIVYFPWDVDRVFWDVMADDHGKLLRNAVQWAANEEQAITVTGPGVLDVTVWRQKTSMTVHLVNLTNPMMMRPSFHELIAAPPQKVRLKMPDGRKAGGVQLLVSGAKPVVERIGDYVTLVVPSVMDHEVIAIDFV